MSKTRKSISAKAEVHELYRRAAARLSTKDRRVTIAELVEFFSTQLPEVKVEEVPVSIKK